MKEIWFKVKRIGSKRIVGIGVISLAIRLIVGGVISAAIIVNWTPSTGRLVSDLDGIEVPSRIIRSSDGNFIIFYYNVPVPLSIDDSNDFDLYAAKIDINGNYIWGGPAQERLISDRARLPSFLTLNFNLFYPKVVSDNTGGAIIGWVEREKWPNDPEAGHIFVKKIDADGITAWVADVEGVNPLGKNILIDLVRGLTPQGETATWVVYEVHQTPACCPIGERGVRLLAKRVRDADGGLVDTLPIVIRDNIIPSGIKETWITQPVVTSDGGGGIIAAWINHEKVITSSSLSLSALEGGSSPEYENIDEILKADAYDLIKMIFDKVHKPKGSSGNPGTEYYSIYGQRIDVFGGTIWPESIPGYGMEIVSASINSRNELKAISGPNDDGIFLVWNEEEVAPNLFIQSVDNWGVKRYDAPKPVMVNEYGGGGALSVVKADPTSAIITWTDLRDFVEPTTLVTHVFAQKIDMTTGTPQWPNPAQPQAVPLAMDGGTHGISSITQDGAGGAYIMWHDIYPAAATTVGGILDTADISIGHIKSNGVVDLPNFTLTITGGQGLGDIIYDGAGGAIVTWSDNRAGSFENLDYKVDLYAQRVTLLPVTLPAPKIDRVKFDQNVIRNDARYMVYIEGKNFFFGATAIFIHTQTGYIIPCYDVNVSEDGKTITCRISVFRADTGVYDLIVTNPDGKSATKPSALNLLSSPAIPRIDKDVRYDAIAQTLTYYIYFWNDGGEPAYNIQVRETIPPGTNLVSYNPPPNMVCEVDTELICYGRDGFVLEPYSEYLLTVTIGISPLIPPVTIDNRARLSVPKIGDFIDTASFTIYPPPPTPPPGAHIYCKWWCLFFGINLGSIGVPEDPNEKQISPMEFVTVDTTLTMRIYFENIGTGPAKDIFITDTLDPFLDEYTLRDISDGGVYDPSTRTIRWALLNRNLQPHESDFVSFRIMPRKDTPRGTWISNKATIVFDINPPLDTPLAKVYIGPPPDWDVLYILNMVRDMLISAKRSVEENDPQNPFYGLKNRGSVIGKLNSAIISVTNAIDSYKAGQMNLTENHIDTCINELNALRNFVSSQEGKTISSDVAREVYHYIDHIFIFLLETAKSLME